MKAVSVGVVKMLDPRLVQSLRDLSSHPLRALAFQEAIPPKVSWISSWQLLLLPRPLTKKIALLPSGVGESNVAEEERWEVVGSAEWRMPSDSMKVLSKDSTKVLSKAGARTSYICPA